MPWWLLGISMVATTFSTDTPNLVTDIVRQNGVAGNWVWWAFLLTGMLTVFVYAKLWRRAGVLTDLEFYEIRYGGRPAAFLRGFRAIYLGVFFNVVIMAAVTLAAIKIAGVILGSRPWPRCSLAGGVTVAFSTLGGLRGVVLTDLAPLLHGADRRLHRGGLVAVGHPEVGGLQGLFTHPNVVGKISLFPDFSDRTPSSPSHDPDRGSVVERLVSRLRTRRRRVRGAADARRAERIGGDRRHALLQRGPLRGPALALDPGGAGVARRLSHGGFAREAFPGVPAAILGHDLAYAAMLTFLPAGLLGLVAASLAAAYMSTISTHLNWGSSYVVHDFWQPLRGAGCRRAAAGVRVGRVSTALLMVHGGAAWPSGFSRTRSRPSTSCCRSGPVRGSSSSSAGSGGGSTPTASSPRWSCPSWWPSTWS
jgi:solute:Na+ symporter, SSS family